MHGRKGESKEERGKEREGKRMDIYSPILQYFVSIRGL
jgi:hypothetical protein